MAAAFGSRRDIEDILEQCDQHKKQLLTVCHKEHTLLCGACLPNHEECKLMHKTIEDVSDTADTTHIRSNLTDRQDRIEHLIIEEKKRFSAIFNKIKLLPQTNDNMRNAENIKAAIETNMNSIVQLRNATKAILNPIGNYITSHMHRKWLVVANMKTEQVGNEVRQIQNGISGLQNGISQNYLAVETKSEVNKRKMEEQQTQEQMMINKQRQEEDSKEMLFRVYGNAIAMLEEYERRKDKKQMPKSKLDLPEDVQANVEIQLKLIKGLLKEGPTNVSSELKKELRIDTIYWAATRAEQMADIFSETDEYIAQVYEILVFDEKREKLSNETVNNTMSAFMVGKSTASRIDEKYERDTSKKASRPQILTTSGASKMRSGAERILRLKPQMSIALDDDVFLVTGCVL